MSARPTSTAEAAEVLVSTRGPVLVRGGGTKLDWGGPVDLDGAGLVLDTQGLEGPYEHNPADLTVAAGAGTRLADLQQRLAETGQWLPFDPPSEADGATLGGLLATGEAGPSRLRSGPLRDLVIGSTLVLADGTVAHSGGRVIKNVAGYDLTKLAAGSLGSLFLVAELVLRVQPRPAASVTLAAPTDLAGASAAALALARSPLEPAALEWSGTGGPGGGLLLVRFDGGAERVEGVLDQARRLPACTPLGLLALTLEEAAAAWAEHRTRSLGAVGRTSLALQVLPDRLPRTAAAVDRAAGRHQTRTTLSAALGTGTLVVGLDGGPADAHEAVLADLRADVGVRGSLLLRGRPAGLVLDEETALGPPPSSADLLRRLKAGLDPDGRFAPGRFRPWY